jgi:hypothetical protein
MIEQSATFGQWIDLQAVVDVKDNTEGEAYVGACAVMMDGPDGSYPAQMQGESDAEYDERALQWVNTRKRRFMDARFVDVMGCGAFFFSNSDRFAVICGHSMSRLRLWLRPWLRPEPRVIPSDGASILN